MDPMGWKDVEPGAKRVYPQSPKIAIETSQAADAAGLAARRKSSREAGELPLS
jgi:hypothetical protein